MTYYPNKWREETRISTLRGLVGTGSVVPSVRFMKSLRVRLVSGDTF